MYLVLHLFTEPEELFHLIYCGIFVLVVLAFDVGSPSTERGDADQVPSFRITI
jgi:hypothetical protein